MQLPEGVHAVRVGRATYYYWHPGRGTAAAGARISLGKDATDPHFWAKLEALRGPSKPGSFSDLIAKYKASAAFAELKPRTKVNYVHQFGRLEAAWGELQVAKLTVAGIYALRAQFEATPVAANHLISCLRTLLKWGLKHGFGTTNPAREIDPIEIKDEENARPWSEDAWNYIVSDAAAPECIRRASFLGRACGQRRVDLVRFGKKNRHADGLAITISKLRDKRHVIPLTKAQLAKIDSWSCSDTGPWIISTIGRTMSGDALQSALNRYIANTPRLQGLEIKMHGLRAMAAIDRKLAGAENRAIAASLRMSLTTVERYLAHLDNLLLARRVRDQLETFTSGQKA